MTSLKNISEDVVHKSTRVDLSRLKMKHKNIHILIEPRSQALSSHGPLSFTTPQALSRPHKHLCFKYEVDYCSLHVLIYL